MIALFVKDETGFVAYLVVLCIAHMYILWLNVEQMIIDS